MFQCCSVIHSRPAVHPAPICDHHRQKRHNGDWQAVGINLRYFNYRNSFSCRIRIYPHFHGLFTQAADFFCLHSHHIHKANQSKGTHQKQRQNKSQFHSQNTFSQGAKKCFLPRVCSGIRGLQNRHYSKRVFTQKLFIRDIQ